MLIRLDSLLHYDRFEIPDDDDWTVRDRSTATILQGDIDQAVMSLDGRRSCIRPQARHDRLGRTDTQPVERLRKHLAASKSQIVLALRMADCRLSRLTTPVIPLSQMKGLTFKTPQFSGGPHSNLSLRMAR